MMGYHDKVYELNKQVARWRSYALGLLLGVLLTNGAWLYFCLRHLQEHP